MPPPAATVEPVRPLPPHTPGAGWARVKAELGDIVPDLTAEDEARADEIIAVAKTLPPGGVVVFDPLPPSVHATPEPLDLTPFLNASLTYYAAWACPRHPLQRRHDPGGCPDCGRALTPVYNVVIPREHP